MKWLLSGPIAAFDTETTGTDVEQDRIVTACVVMMAPQHPGQPWDQDVRSWLIDPGVDIPEAASAVHGITSAYAKEHGEQPEHALDQIADALARLFAACLPIVVCNGAFDFTILDRELRRYGLSTLDARIGRPIGPVVDVYVIDKYVDQYRPGGRKLSNLVATYDVRMDGAHDSTADAIAAARVAYRMAQRSQEPRDALIRLYGGLGRRSPQEIADRWCDLGALSPTDLHDCQVIWREQQMTALHEFHERKGIKDGDYDPSWPMRPYPNQQEPR